MRGLLGGKGANLAEMTAIGLPVPDGFTITTEACLDYLRAGGTWPDGLRDQVREHLAALEGRVGRKLGDPSDPLLVSVRSGAPVSMPGMMDTILNLGLNDRSVRGPRETEPERAVRARLVPPLRADVRRRRDGCRRAAVRGGARPGQGRPGRRGGRRSGRRRPAPAARAVSRHLPRRAPARSSPRTRRSSSTGPSRRCSAPGTRPERPSTAATRASPTTSAPPSTSSRWCSATSGRRAAPASRSPATRRPASGSSTASSW